METGFLVLARGLHMGSGLMLVALVAFRWLVLRSAFRQASDATWKSFAPLFVRLNRIFIGSGIMLVFSGLLLFWVVAAGMSGQSLSQSLDLETWGTVAWQTQFGRVFLARFALSILLALMTHRLRSVEWQGRRGGSAWETMAGLTAVGLLISFAWTGHSVASSGTAFLGNVTADSIHLLAASIWPTGLLPFAIFLAYARKIEKVSPQIEKAVARFSATSLVTVLVLTGTGVINGYFLVGSLSALFNTPYGEVLLVKLFLFFIILCVAGWNRYRLLPAFFAKTSSDHRDEAVTLLAKLRTFVLIEFSLAVGILAVVSLLGTMPPSR